MAEVKTSTNLIDDEDMAKIVHMLKDEDISGWFGNNTGGPYLQEFQRKFAQYCTAKYAFGVSSGSASIYVALKACGVGHGDVVAVPAYTHVGSVAPIVLAGATPLFVDVDDFGNIDPQDLNEAIYVVTRVRGVKAVVVVHQLGVPCEIDAIREVAQKHHLWVIEDASHALGAEYKGKRCGVLGDIGCFSIGGGRTKTIGTGEGGMVVTNNDELAEKVQNIRNHGDRVTDAPYFCFNFRMCDLNALVGLAQISSLDFLNDWQIENATYLTEQLPDCLNARMPPSHVKSTWYIVGCDFTKGKVARDSFLQEVYARGFRGGMPRKNVSPGYSKLVSDIAVYKPYQRSLPNSEKIRDQSVWIDYHRYPRTKEEIDALMNCFAEVLGVL